MNQIDRKASRRIKELRKARRSSQQAIADSVNITRTSISNIENERQALSLDLFCRIAEALGTSPVALLDEIIKYDALPRVTSADVKDPKIRKLIQRNVH